MKISGWMGYQTMLKRAPIFWGYICGKWGIGTFWGRSVVRGKVVFSPSGVLLMSPATIYITHTQNLPITQSTTERSIYGITQRDTTASGDQESNLEA